MLKLRSDAVKLVFRPWVFLTWLRTLMAG